MKIFSMESYEMKTGAIRHVCDIEETIVEQAHWHMGSEYLHAVTLANVLPLLSPITHFLCCASPNRINKAYQTKQKEQPCCGKAHTPPDLYNEHLG